MTKSAFSLHRPGSGPYQSALELFNGAIQMAPEAVVVPANEVELAAALREASRSGMSVSLRAGGHGVAGRAVQGRWVIDMRRFKDAKIAGRRVWAGAGLTWQELDEVCATEEIAVPGGTVSSTGVAGLTLGGGVGWLLPQAGLTCDHLVAVKAVTGDGEILRIADADDVTAMTFLRGFGHGLMAVTEFEFESVSVPPNVSAGSVAYRFSDSHEVIEALLSASQDCPESINWSPVLMKGGDSQILSVDGVSFGKTGFDVWVQSNCKVRPIYSSVGNRPYPAAQGMLDNPARWGQRCSWRSLFTNSLTSDAIAFLVESFSKAPSDGCQIFIERMTGSAKFPPRPSAFPLRWADYDVLITAGWSSIAQNKMHRDWLQATKDGLSKLVSCSPDTGTYSNYADLGERVAVKDKHTIPELNDVRLRYDPYGIFSIHTAAATGSAPARNTYGSLLNA